MTDRQRALLLLAHGERLEGRANNAVRLIASALRERKVADEVAVGFLSAAPSVEEAITHLTAPRLLVYPLFMAEGYFLRIATERLRRAAAQNSRGRMPEILPPLGVDSRLAELVTARATAVAIERGFALSETALVLVAHGSLRHDASRTATDALVERVRACSRFGRVSGAFLEQPPSFQDALADHAAAVVVTGLFVGDGLHGQADLQRLLGGLPADRVAFAGNAGSWPQVADLIAASAACAPETD